MDRRRFLTNSSLALGTGLLSSSTSAAANAYHKLRALPATADKWARVRADFELDNHHIQMSQMLLASHPKPVRDAIAAHRRAFDVSPATYWEQEAFERDGMVTEAAAKYLECTPGEIGLTDSTTQGMSLLLNGMRLKPGDEVLATTHDHYITDTSIAYACAKKGATHRHIDEYDDASSASVDEVVTKIRSAIRPATRVVVVTWVHSCSGVKLPIRAIADMLDEVNNGRNVEDRIYFCVDGVHGFGNQADAVASLGCDFFAAGTHKWLFGPRGTGIVWAKRDAWDFVDGTIPPFTMNPYLEWLGEPMQGELTFMEKFSPGGFHAFEHRWALQEAFEYQLSLGRSEVHARTTALNTRLKEGVRDMAHVKLHTPFSPELSAGINCFEFDGMNETEAVEYFHQKGIIASSSPYKVSYARLTPCVINTEEEVDKCLEVIAGMAS